MSALDVKLTVSMGFGSLERVEREVVACDGICNLRGSRLDFAAVGGDDHGAGTTVARTDAIISTCLALFQLCEVPILIGHHASHLLPCAGRVVASESYSHHSARPMFSK